MKNNVKKSNGGNKTMSGLEHNAIDKIAAAILNCEDSKFDEMRKLLHEAIGVVVEMRLLHERYIEDHESPEHP